MPPIPRLQFDIERIASALWREPIRSRLLRAYGIDAAPSSPRELCEAIWTAFGQTSRPSTQREAPNADEVFRAAVRAIGSNSRNWSTFVKNEKALEALLSGGPQEVAQQASDELEKAIAACLPGQSSSADARAILAWAKRLSEHPDWGTGLHALRQTVREQLGAHGCKELDLPAVAVLLGAPPKDFPGWQNLPTPYRDWPPETWKAPGMGAILAAEFLRNLHWSGYKPDRHVKRLLRLWAPALVSAQHAKAAELGRLLHQRDKSTHEFLEVSLAALELTPDDTDPSQIDNLVWALGAQVERAGMESDTRYLTDEPSTAAVTKRIRDFALLLPSPQEEVVWTSCLALALAETTVENPLWSAFCEAFHPPLPFPAHLPRIEVERPVEAHGQAGRADLALEYEDNQGGLHIVLIEAKVGALSEHGDQLTRYQTWVTQQANARGHARATPHLATLLLHKPPKESEIHALEARAGHDRSSQLWVHRGRWRDFLLKCEVIPEIPSPIHYLQSQLKRRMITHEDIDRVLAKHPGHYPMLIEAVDKIAAGVRPVDSPPRYFSGTRESGAGGAEWNPSTSSYEYGHYWYDQLRACIGVMLRMPVNAPVTNPGSFLLVHYTDISGENGRVEKDVELENFESVDAIIALFKS